MQNTQDNLPPTRKPTLLAGLLGLGIIFLTAANGFFTFSGATLYVEETIYALLFAIAVQFAIAMTLLALPYVRGLGKPTLLVVYTAALILSTLSAYTYVYNASLPGEMNIQALDTTQKAGLSDAMASAIQQERQALASQYAAMEKLRRTTEEEATLGLSSGMGPGKGREYYRKLEQYESLKTDYQLELQRVERAEEQFYDLSQSLMGSPDGFNRDAILAGLGQFRSQLRSESAIENIKSLVDQDISIVATPVDKAVEALKDYENYTVNTIVSLIWASVFDLLALFLGIIRYYLLHTSKPLLTQLYDGLLGFSTFLFRLTRLPSDAQGHYRSQLNTKAMPLNSTEMQNFATYLLSGSQLSMAEDSSSTSEPIQTIIKYLEPLYSEKNTNMVGIPWDNIGNEPRLAPLVAMLVQSKVFLNDSQHEAYVLNSSADYAQKILVLMRLGMKEPPESMAGVDFLLNDSPSALATGKA